MSYKFPDFRQHKNFLISFILFVSILIPVSASAQVPGYAFLNDTVYKRSALTGEILSSGMMLYDGIVDQEEVIKVTLRYASDTTAFTRNGVEHDVERLMDFYYPSPDIIFEDSDGQEIEKLPLMIVLHAGQGNKDTAGDYARYWASMGYTVLTPTVRSDRLGVNYCEAYLKTIYLTVQDLRAAIRLYSKLYDYSEMDPVELQALIPDRETGELVDHWRQSRTDAAAIFMVGRSYGGSTAYHTATRTNQTDFEEYIWADTPYIINGANGPVDMGNSGLLDDVGIDFAKDHPFPSESMRGVICRTAGVFKDMETINYDQANKVPGVFIHNTCDKVVPYSSRTYIHNNLDCNATILLPDGTGDTSLVMYGSEPITQLMADNGIYSELITFCGGGHSSNVCRQDLNDHHSNKFVFRILTGSYQPGDRFERVYRYHFQNYSPQCCDIGDEYGYIPKCSCEEENPHQVIDLPYQGPDDCPFSPNCTLTSLCDLEAPGFEGNETGTDLNEAVYTLEPAYLNGETTFLISSPVSSPHNLSIVDMTGRELFSAYVELEQGANSYQIPAKLPRGQLLIARLEGAKAVKFQIPK